MAIEPTFTYSENREKERFTALGEGEQVTLSEGESSKEEREKKKKRRKKSGESRSGGSSFGWGWFQGFNLFITFYFLTIFIIFGYFMMGGETRHEGPPKYVLDKSDAESGKVVFNPQIPKEIRDSYTYVRPEEVTPVDSETVDHLILLSESGSDFTDIDMPELNLLSSSEERVEEVAQEVKKYRVEELLLMAEEARSVGHYVGAKQQDAYYFYQEVLKQDPNNEAAKFGLQDIAYLYYQNAQKAYDEGDYGQADQYVKVGLIIEPNNQFLLELKSLLQ